MNADTQQEHRWLDRLVGKWSFEAECQMSPDQPSMKNRGLEVVQSLGGLWTIGEGESEMPEGGTANTVMTLGYDPQAKRFVGTFIASMMTHLWLYNGSLDESGKVLTLDTEGPASTDQGMAKYQDCMEFVDDDHRILTSRALGEDGQWHVFMTAHYRRES